MNLKKFTLMELLIVIAIIGLLMTFLLPSLNSAREKAKFASCISNKSQNHRLIMMGAKDNNGKLPLFFYQGNRNLQGDWYHNNKSEPNYEIDDWMGTIGKFGISPYKRGKRYSIVNPVAALYTDFDDWKYKWEDLTKMELHPISSILRCPSLEEGTLNSGVGSNGAFDYSFPQALRGFYLNQVESALSWHGTDRPTPLIVEEDPASNINNGYTETSWANSDSVGTWHDFGKKGSYTTIDGSSYTVRAGLKFQADDNPTVLIKGEYKSLRNAATTGAKSISNLYLEPGNKYAPKITRF